MYIALIVSPELSDETVARNRDVLSEVRLWDPRAIGAVYQQFQAIRLYYDIGQVDIDRYKINGLYRQVMISARESFDLQHTPMCPATSIVPTTFAIR